MTLLVKIAIGAGALLLLGGRSASSSTSYTTKPARKPGASPEGTGAGGIGGSGITLNEAVSAGKQIAGGLYDAFGGGKSKGDSMNAPGARDNGSPSLDGGWDGGYSDYGDYTTGSYGGLDEELGMGDVGIGDVDPYTPSPGLDPYDDGNYLD